LAWGAKTATVANLRGQFCSFFLEGQNRNFVKVRGRKLLLGLILYSLYIFEGYYSFHIIGIIEKDSYSLLEYKSAKSIIYIYNFNQKQINFNKKFIYRYFFFVVCNLYVLGQ